MKKLYTYDSISADSLYNEKRFKQTWYRNSNTYFTLNMFSAKCHLWSNMGKYGEARQATDSNTLRSMPFACWVNKATDTHLQYVILIAFPLLQQVGQRTSILILTYTGCLVCKRDYLVAKGFRLCKARLHCWVSSPDCSTDFPLHKHAQPNSWDFQPTIQSVPGIVSL